MIKKVLLPFILCCALFAACKKNNNNCTAKDSTKVATTAEIQHIQQYLSDSSITAVQHPSGIFYTIETQGNATSPNICSYINVRYTGMFFNRHIFDQSGANSSASFDLSNLIIGWQKGLPLIGVGGKITLYIPPTLAYGPGAVYDQGVEIIPANSYMIFEIELLNIQ